MIRETGKVETLSFIDPRHNVDCVTDFIGSHGGLTDGQFTYDDDQDIYLCDQETYDWWSKVITDHQVMEERIKALCDKYGSGRVYDVVHQVADCDLEDMPAAVDAALDEAFAGK